MTTLFLLSPAYCGGRRATMLVRPGATHQMAARLQAGTLSLGEAFAFMSGLYFRGKLAYARSFARPAAGVSGVMVITPCQGLRSPDVRVGRPILRRYAGVDIDAADRRYRRPLMRDARALAMALAGEASGQVVLLGAWRAGSTSSR